MSRWKIDRHFAAATAALLGATLIAGCLAGPSSTDIQVPQVSKRILGGGSSQNFGTRSPGDMILRPIVIAADSVIMDLPAWVRSDSTQALGSQSFTLDGSVGGTFTFGRYKLEFPPYAVRGNGVVTISIPDPAVVGCDLSISPANLNGFNKPVRLTIECSRTNLADSGVVAIHSLPPLSNGGRAAPLATPVHIKPPTGVYWSSPAGWMWMGGEVDTTTWEIAAPLQHFSTYRAGW